MPFVDRPGARIHYEVAGEGPAVVLLHGFLFSGAMWAPQLDALARRRLVVNVDARGHGGSGPAHERFTLADLVEDHLAVLDAVGVQRAVWVGLSMGGMVALRAALAAPSRVAALALLDSDGGAELLRVRARFAALALLARRVGLAGIAPRVAALMFGETTRRTSPALVADWSRSFATMDLASALRGLRAISRRQSLARALPRIALPALVVVGAEDEALPPERSRRLARGLPRARLVEIPGAGHLSTLEQPARVTAALVEFLAEIGWEGPPGRRAETGG